MRMLALILALLAGPAFAGTQAVYAGGDGKKLRIEVDDAGDARIGEVGASDYGLLKDGHFYVVGDAGGRLTVARIEDVAAAIDRIVPPIFHDMLTGAAVRPSRLKIERQGAATIAGQAGTRYAVRGLNETKPDAVETYVMSDDPALKPVGAALEGFMNASVLPAAALLGPAAAELVAQTRTIFALGTPLAAGTRLTLERIETARIAPARRCTPLSAVAGRRARVRCW